MVPALAELGCSCMPWAPTCLIVQGGPARLSTMGRSWSVRTCAHTLLVPSKQ